MVDTIASSPAVDLSTLPAPVLVDQPDFETRFAAKLARLQAAWAEYSALVESDPAYKLVEADAYDELVLAQACNDAAKQNFLAFAKGPNLDHQGALVDTPRLVVAPATETTDEVMEEDGPYRSRIQLAPHQFSVAGPEQAYVYHARSAHGDVADATAESPVAADIQALVLQILNDHGVAPALVTAMTEALEQADWPGDVTVSVLSASGDGVPSAEVLAAVDAKLQGAVRPMTDYVKVQAVELVDFDVQARLYVFSGPDEALILSTAQDSLDAHLSTIRKMGRDITRSGLIAALHVGNVQRVELLQPAADVPVANSQIGNCVSATVTIGGTEW